MHASKIGFFAILTLALTVSVLSYSLGRARVAPSRQSSPQTPAVQTPAQAPPESSPTGRRRAQRQPPCWRLAGISPELVNKQWHIEDNAKGKISAVCTDAALNAEKKREKIQEINGQTEQEMAKIIPAKQLEAFKSCQAEREQEKAKRREANGEKELGPCGGIIPSEPSHQHQPANPPKQ